MAFASQRAAMFRSFSRTGLCALLSACLVLWVVSDDGAQESGPAKLELQTGEHISVIGNTLADRMQHDGWLETYVQSRFPAQQLVFRNLGFAADEVTTRLRSARFGTPDEWLTFTFTDVVFAFFGYNESFAGEAGIPKFRADLEAFLKHTRAQKYNGKTGARVVLFSPIAHEDLHDRNLPDGRANNARLERYTAVMAEVAREQGAPFVDLFHPLLERYAKAVTPLTINGVHLTAQGNRALAEIVDQALFGNAPVAGRSPEALEKVRQAVLDKDFYWFNRYRTVDGYSIYGMRADLRFVNGQTNKEVCQREMEVLDVMTANRDKRVWAVARGGELVVDDSNTPPFIPVITNKPGKGPSGTHIFEDPEAAIKLMTVARGMRVNLFASEKEFPELTNAVQMSFDPQGRLWVAVWPSYPHWKPKEEMNDKLLILEDTDGDGKADKCTIFADHLHCPTGFEFYNGGVLIAQAPDLMYLKDTDGDGKADLRVRVLSGLDSADTHHTSNSFALDPGGALYFQEGTFHHTQVETPYGPAVRNVNAGVYRYEPRTQKFEVYVSYGFANPHGHVFDRWGQDVVVDGTGANPYHGALFSGHVDYPMKHNQPPQIYQQRTRPCPGVEILSSRHFPDENQGNLLVPNVIGFQGVLQYKLEDQGASFGAREVEPLVSSTDPNFRPSDIKVGPDGAIYFTDWHNPIIGHMQHNLRDPSRDRTHGRIYRVSAPGRPLLKPVKIAAESIPSLLELLKEPEDRVRYRARIELGGRDSNQVIEALDRWLAALDRQDANFEHNRLEGLWLQQAHNQVKRPLLEGVLASPDFHARAAATRVLCYVREQFPDALVLLKKQAADDHPRVRLEAIRAASFFGAPEALDVALSSTDRPSDQFIDFVRNETLRTLEPIARKAIASGAEITFASPAATRFFLKSVSLPDLLKMKRTVSVSRELLFRPAVRDEDRRAALTSLAKLEANEPLKVLVTAITNQDGQMGQDESVSFDLVRLLTGFERAQLAAVRPELEKLSLHGQAPLTRELGFVSLIACDGGIERAWELAKESPQRLLDLVSAMPLVRDPNDRQALYPRIEPLLTGASELIAGAPGGHAGSSGRFVRIELPGNRKTLSLAEVEVYSAGRNVARFGKATQKNSANGGGAERAIDGNTSGTFDAGSVTHSVQNTANPWWQVDLGDAYPIDSVVIFNRTDAELGKRLNGFTLKILDRDQKVIFEQRNQPAPAPKAAFRVGVANTAQAIRVAAMQALTSVRGQEASAFKVLAKLASNPADRQPALQALEHIPTLHWPKPEAKDLLDALVKAIRNTPVQQRTSPASLEALQVADALAALQPSAEAKRIRQELGELGVRVIRLGTVPDQMLFDKERLAARTGKPFEIIFENNDLMPHNFALLQPGALEEIGLLAEATAAQPGAIERGYVPRSEKVLAASRLLQPRDMQRISLMAPAKPGIYPYVCTYPGHWRRMFGALYVVEDLDAYLENPESYLAQHPLPLSDELLKFNRPRTEWKLEEFTAALDALPTGRSFANAKQLFQAATCVSCHRMNGVGNEFGPDLTKIDPKNKPADILRDILEPSWRINEKYQAFLLELKSGKTLTGLILAETPTALKVIENPLVKAEPIEIRKADIEEKKALPTSVMPKGLLDKLTREEILDLLSYIWSKGDAKHPLFQGGHSHQH
jgi:putative heme-binding domain-containing protein